MSEDQKRVAGVAMYWIAWIIITALFILLGWLIKSTEGRMAMHSLMSIFT